MSILKIEQSKKIVEKAKELLLFVDDNEDVCFLNSIIEKNDILIREFNKNNLTVIDATKIEIGIFNRFVKTIAKMWFKEKIYVSMPIYPEGCEICLKANKEIEEREIRTGIFENSIWCKKCLDEDINYDIEYQKKLKESDKKLDLLSKEIKKIKIDEYWMNAYILLNREYKYNYKQQNLREATKEIIRNEILKTIKTIKL